MRFHYVFQARDYDAAVRFYGTGLGLSVVESWDRGPDKGTMFRAAGGIVEVVSDSLGLRGPDRHGVVIQVPDVDPVYQRALRAGLTVEQPPGPRPWGTKEFILLDPDRHAVTFFEAPAEPTAPLGEQAAAILDARCFATVATLNPDGGPQTSVVWVDRDGDTALFSTTARRRKATNLRRDPRVSLTAYPPEDPYQTVEIRGVAELAPDGDRALYRRVWRKYRDEDPPPEPADVHRLTVRVRPRRVRLRPGRRGC